MSVTQTAYAGPKWLRWRASRKMSRWHRIVKKADRGYTTRCWPNGVFATEPYDDDELRVRKPSGDLCRKCAKAD